jgi:hypothetical protein
MTVLVSVLRRARQAGGDVKLVHPRFDRVFDMAETTEAALKSFWGIP